MPCIFEEPNTRPLRFRLTVPERGRRALRRICARMRSDSCKKEPATSPEASYSMEASKTAKGVGMGICIGYESAYEFWRRADDGRACLLQTDRARSSYEMTGIALRRKTSRADIERARAFGFDDEPLHAVVPIAHRVSGARASCAMSVRCLCRAARSCRLTTALSWRRPLLRFFIWPNRFRSKSLPS